MNPALQGARLYGYWRSTSSWRVRIALEHKGVPVEGVPVHLLKDGGEQHAGPFIEKNPLEQVPVLELKDGRRFFQSLAIIELLEELVPTPSLLPRDPFARAIVRELAEIVNSGTQPLQNLAVLQALKARGVDEQAWSRAAITRGVAALERVAQGSAGRFLVGDDVTIADCCLVPQLFGARRYGVELAPFARLLEIEARCLALPAFQKTAPALQPDAAP